MEPFILKGGFPVDQTFCRLMFGTTSITAQEHNSSKQEARCLRSYFCCCWRCLFSPLITKVTGIVGAPTMGTATLKAVGPRLCIRVMMVLHTPVGVVAVIDVVRQNGAGVDLGGELIVGAQ